VIDDRPTDILVKIDAAGCRWVGRRWAPDAEFRQAIRNARAASPLGRLVLQADRTLPYGAVRALLADLRDEDIYTLSLIVEPPPQETFGLVGAQ
jgi:biopolymer transport protein ExbD